MGRYSEYCESGAGWLGELPSHWQLRRISALYDARNEKVSDQDYPPLSVTMQGIVPQLETAAKTQDGDNRKLVRTGDFVINSRSDRRGACGISAYDGSVTLISNVLAPKDRNAMSTRYYSYLFRSEGFADEFYRQGTGIVDDLWSTNWTRMKNILVARPPLAEQKSIADYLDAKTAEIDALVADCERVVGLLREYRKAVISEAVTKGLDPDAPMKRSGSKWVSEIPENWDVIPLKHFSKLITDGVHQTPEYIDEGIPFLSIKDMSNGAISFEDCKYISYDQHLELSKHAPIEEGDLLFARIGTLGVTVVVKNCPTFDIFVSLGLIKLKGGAINGDYLAYCMNSDYYCSYIQTVKAGGGTAAAKFNLGDVSRSPIIQPPPEEQEKIVAYLDAKTSEIDSLIEAKQEMADKLREYRKSLISEAVTGKFKVPGV